MSPLKRKSDDFTSYLENVGKLSQTEKTEVSTIRPTMNGNATGVDTVGRFSQPLQYFDLILELHSSLNENYIQIYNLAIFDFST